MEMTSSSDATRSSLSDNTLDSLHKGMVCAYHIGHAESNARNDEALDNLNNKPTKVGADGCADQSPTIRRRTERQVPDEDIRAEPELQPSSYDQKDLMNILMNIQTQQDTLLGEMRDIKDTQREIQRDLTRLKGSISDGDLSVTGLNYGRRARYSIRPPSTVSSGIQDMAYSEQTDEEIKEENFDIRL